MIKFELKLILYLILAIFLFGCDKVSHGNQIGPNKNSDTIEEIEEDNSDVAKYKNIYEFDSRNRIDEIDKNGYFEDAAGYKFDKYIKSKHFELYYNLDNKSSKLNAEGSIEILENEYDRVIDFFDADENDIPIVKINMYEDYEQLRQVLIKEINYDINFIKVMNKTVTAGYACKTNTFYYILNHNGRPVDDIKTIVVHEFTHNVTMALANKMYHDAWMFEGLAMFLAQDNDRYIPYYEDMINKGIPEISKLKFNSPDKYKYGYSMVEYIIEEYGKEKLLELYREYEDIEKVLNVTESEFRDGWIEFLNEKINKN